MYKFIREVEQEDTWPEFRVEYSIDAENLNEVLEGFENFLRGCGFHFEGKLCIMGE